MSIRGHGNKQTELALIKFFRQHGITGWRRHRPIFGKPDFIFPRLKLAIFVDGCFWHQCPKHSNIPQNNRPFWLVKLAANKRRDRLVNRTLTRRGWRVLRVWEHELARKREPILLRRIRRACGKIPNLKHQITNKAEKRKNELKSKKCKSEPAHPF